MKITIIGAGAMGCLFGGLLKEAGAEIQLLDVWEEHVRTLNRDGISITCNGTQRFIQVAATTDPAEINKTDLALIFVKHAQTAAAAETAVQLAGKKGAIMTLQNGMGNAEILARTADPSQIISGTTAQGAMILGAGKIQHSGKGKTIIGMWEGTSHPLLEPVASLFTRAGIETTTTNEIRPVLWSKLFANVGINAITALTGISNGQLLDQPETRQLVTAAVNEAIAVAAALNIPVSPNALEHVFDIARATASNRSSMGQDVDRQRPTEINAINGYILQKAKETGINVPVNSTLTALIQTLQEHYPQEG
jgi:2-dehydropantoate 2-reductase